MESERPPWPSSLCRSRQKWAVASPGRIPFRCENCAVHLEDAKRRIEQHSELQAFISISDETGKGPVVAVKDLVDVKGMVTTAGGIILPQTPAADDAPVVQRLRRHGCVMVGKTNLHEFAYGVTSVNPHYGPVLNPHDPSRVAGGSAGGSAVPGAPRTRDRASGSGSGGSVPRP